MLPKRSQGRVCGLQRNRQGLFRAKTSFEHIRLYSSYTFGPVAVEYHILLVRLRQLVMSARLGACRGGVSELCEAFAAAFAELEREPVADMSLHSSALGAHSRGDDLNDFLPKYGIRSYLSIHVDRWLGSTVVSSPVLPLVDILRLRKQLLLARSQGLESFRDACLEMLKIGGSGSKGLPTGGFRDETAATCHRGHKRQRRVTEALRNADHKLSASSSKKAKPYAPVSDVAFQRLQVAVRATERALAAGRKRACPGTSKAFRQT